MSKRGFTASKDIAKKTKKPKVPTPPPTMTASWRLILPSLQLFKRFGAPVLGMLLLPILVVVLGQLLTKDFKAIDTTFIQGVLFQIWGWSGLIVGLCLLQHYSLHVVSGQTTKFSKSYRESLRFMPRIYGLAVLLFFVIITGLVLLIVPGLIFIRRYVLSVYFLIDGDTGIREAMQRSAAATKPLRGYVWSTLAIILLPIAVGAGLSWPIGMYSLIVAVMLASLLAFVPALRYKEIINFQAASAVKN